ncbi:MAG TPA: hypothetical protein VGA27_04145 [Candidatus Binatia bacterium]
MNITALAAGDTQNLLTLGSYDNRRFRNPATTKTADRSSHHDMLAEGYEKLDLFRRREVGNWQGAEENTNRASRTHEANVTPDNKARRGATVIKVE